MARLFFLLLATAVLFTSACIPVKNSNAGILFCTNHATPYNLSSDGVVSAVLEITGLSLLDFILLQDGHLGNNVTPRTTLNKDTKLCLAGYFA